MLTFCTVVITLFIARAASDPLKLCAFDVQLLGQWKVKLGPAMEAVKGIIERCDVCVIQQIRSAEVVEILLEQLNEDGDAFGIELGSPVGRMNNKEQIGIFYKKASVSVLDTYTFNDPKDIFERDPFLVKFKITSPADTRRPKGGRAPRSLLKEFFVIGVRTDPSQAAEEIDGLVSVYDDAKSRFKVEDGVIMGNLNAACNFFPKADREKSVLLKDLRFQWLIKDDVDTSVTESTCAYDRIIAAGVKLRLRSKNAGVFKFDTELSMSPREAKRVSDHYPVEFTID